VFERIHTRKKDRLWVDKRSAEANEAFTTEKKRLEADRQAIMDVGGPEPPSIDDDEIWTRIASDRKKGRIYGQGVIPAHSYPLLIGDVDYDNTATDPPDMREQAEAHHHRVAEVEAVCDEKLRFPTCLPHRRNRLLRDPRVPRRGLTEPVAPHNTLMTSTMFDSSDSSLLYLVMAEKGNRVVVPVTSQNIGGECNSCGKNFDGVFSLLLKSRSFSLNTSLSFRTWQPQQELQRRLHQPRRRRNRGLKQQQFEVIAVTEPQPPSCVLLSFFRLSLSLRSHFGLVSPFLPLPATTAAASGHRGGRARRWQRNETQRRHHSLFLCFDLSLSDGTGDGGDGFASG
ncbi:hypothetical protein PIB30_062142, partial [Stylosanthes scabra]|nr:hypothetical protein [Stylosanthes scabra]